MAINVCSVRQFCRSRNNIYF